MSPVMEIEPVKEVVLVTAAWGALYYLFMQMGPAPCALHHEGCGVQSVHTV